MQRLISGVLLVFLFACSDTSVEDEISRPTGQELAEKYLLVDTHIDVPYRLYRSARDSSPEDISQSTSSGQFDYPRAVMGGLNVPFMSIYIPASVDEEGGATALADELIDSVEDIIIQHPDKFAKAHSTFDVQKNFETGRISLAMGMENGAPIAADLKNLEHFYNRGIRYITLTHSKSNHICDSSYDDNKQWDGLSEFGETLIPAMNDIGIMVDISHVSDAAFYDVLAITNVPVIASHSSARHFVPGFERNMDDEMLSALAGNEGVMQLNIGSTFISKISRDSADHRRELALQFLKENDLESGSDEANAATKKIFDENPLTYASMDDVLDHIDHVVKVAGIDHIGIGSDFDGVGDSLPVGFKDVSDYPAFIDALLGRGYSESDIEKILGGNLMRVWKTVEHYAAEHPLEPISPR